MKTFSKPNLDDGNRFYDDNLKLREKYAHADVLASSGYNASGFKPYASKKSIGTVKVTDTATKSTRSYRTLGGYTPKNYATKARTPA